MFWKRKNGFKPSPPEAELFRGTAVDEFNHKQAELSQNWRFDVYSRWQFVPEDGLLHLDYADGARLTACGQLLGTYMLSDSSFEWAWNNPRFPDAIIRDSLLVKAASARLDAQYLAAGMIPVRDEEHVSFLCAIALKVTDSTGVFRGSEGDVHPIILVKDLRWD